MLSNSPSRVTFKKETISLNSEQIKNYGAKHSPIKIGTYVDSEIELQNQSYESILHSRKESMNEYASIG